MSILQKTRIIERVQTGGAGQRGTSAVPATEGYYTTIEVSKTVTTTDIPAIGNSSGPSTSISIEGDEMMINWRVATYNEIVKALAMEGSSKCAIAVKIMTLLHTTQYLYTVIKRIDANTYLGVAPNSSSGTTGWSALSAIRYRSASETPYPKNVLNPFFKGFSWNFYSELQCVVEDGVEIITPLALSSGG